MNNITLYYAPDNASLIVRIVLEELGLPYRTVLVDRARNEQQSEQYLRLNPTGLIPVCLIDDQVVTETAAIVLTLAEADSSLALAVDEPDRASFLRWLFFLSNTLHPDLRQLFYAEKYTGSSQALQADFRDKTKARISATLETLNSQYLASEQVYLFHAEPTVVDIYLSICLRWLQLYPLVDRGWFTLADYPALQALAEALECRPAVIRACEAEGITGKFLSEATEATPPEGSAT